MQSRKVTLTEDQWIYLQNKLESILKTEEDDKLEVISATIFAKLVGLKQSSEEEVDKAKVLHKSVFELAEKNTR